MVNIKFTHFVNTKCCIGKQHTRVVLGTDNDGSPTHDTISDGSTQDQEKQGEFAERSNSRSITGWDLTTHWASGTSNTDSC